ncbi:hypothetical protein BS78_02G069100 [Paspalum vaginatum]|nr:hypothetical protein BS78_02G069100 [Paspalum vaginatum]
MPSADGSRTVGPACRSPHVASPARPWRNRRTLLLSARGSPPPAGRRRLPYPSAAAVADQISSRSSRRSHRRTQPGCRSSARLLLQVAQPPQGCCSRL